MLRSNKSSVHVLLLIVHSKSENNEEKIRCLGSLGSSKHKSIIIDALDFCLSDKVRAQDSYITFVYCGRNYYVYNNINKG